MADPFTSINKILRSPQFPSLGYNLPRGVALPGGYVNAPSPQSASLDGPSTRVGDLPAMLRTLRPLKGWNRSPLQRKREMLASWFRMMGENVVGKTDAAPSSAVPASTPQGSPSVDFSPAVPPVAEAAARAASNGPAGSSATTDAAYATPDGKALSPRLAETLNHLLAGRSEKEIAGQLKLSRHTVHVYVKALYRRFNVTSRAELFARQFRP